GGAQPHRPRGGRTPVADGRAGRGRACADPLLPRAVGAARRRLRVASTAARRTCPSGTCPGVKHLDMADWDLRALDRRLIVRGHGPSGDVRCQTPAVLGSATASIVSGEMGSCRIITLVGIVEVGRDITSFMRYISM